MNASPLNMGLLTTQGPPTWHPASPELRRAVDEAKEVVADSRLTIASRPVKIEDVAVSFGMRDVGSGPTPPVVVGVATLDQVSNTLPFRYTSLTLFQVHQAVASYVAVKHPKDKAQDEQLEQLEQRVRHHIEERGFKDWSWESPQPGT